MSEIRDETQETPEEDLTHPLLEWTIRFSEVIREGVDQMEAFAASLAIGNILYGMTKHQPEALGVISRTWKALQEAKANPA